MKPIAIPFLLIAIGLVLFACTQPTGIEPAVGATGMDVTDAIAGQGPDAQSTADESNPQPGATVDVAGLVATRTPTVTLDDAGPAPEIANDTWINSDVPLTLASQRGKVVMLEFWTFGCINCQRVIPYVREWHDEYAGDDFEVISIHYPEFPREREYDNVVEATQRFEIAYPVALDNDGRTWRAYQQRYWPTTYLIDKNGHIRYKHIGEFNERSAAQAQIAIEALIAETQDS